MRYLFIAITFLFLGCKHTASINKGKTDIPIDLDYLYKNNKIFKNHSNALVVYDVENNKYLYKHNDNQYFTPASNTKILTCLASIKLLDDKLELGKVYKNNAGECVLKPYGDPSFLNPKFTQPQTISWFKKNCYKINILDYQPFKPYGPGWAWDDMNDEYSTQRSVLPVYGGLIKAIIHRDTTQNIHIKQYLMPKIFRDSLILDSDYDKPKRKNNSNIIKWKRWHKHKSDTIAIPIIYNNKMVANIIADKAQVPTTFIENKPLWNKNSISMKTIQVDSVLKELMVYSDNFIAEQLLIQIGMKHWGTNNLEDIIEKIVENKAMHIDQHSQWVDGSGLSRYNLLTPNDLVLNLKTILMAKKMEWIKHIFAVGGVSGTIKDWYKSENESNEPYVFAKTGTLKNVHNIAGYLQTKSGKTLIFCFMNNQMTISYDELRSQIQNILAYLYNKY